MKSEKYTGYVLITGATSGIGLSTLKKFHNKGYFVFFTYKNNENKATQIENAFSNSKSFQLDLSSNSNIKSFFEKFNKLKVKLDVLINNAAQTKFIDSNIENSFDEIDFLENVQINLVSVYAMIFHAEKIMSPASNIVNLASVAAINGVGSNIAYSASKAGIVNLTKSLSKKFKGKIRVNSVAPGLLKSNLTKNFPEEYFESYKNLTSMGRLANADEIADVIISIVCDMKFVNGQCIVVDGGCV
jgi:3-oxoacyl-[acyl-carrier protein] reductase